MEHPEYLQRVAELTKEIEALPKGYLSQKKSGGRVYFYHQWSEQGSKKSRYLKNEEIAPLSEKIERRKALRAELKAVKAKIAAAPRPEASKEPFSENETALMYILMHKSVAVAELWIDEATGFIAKTGAVYAPEHLPVGIRVKNGVPDKKSLQAWWTERSIPASRSGVREALQTIGLTDTKALLTRCCGLSLSDQYWVRPRESGLKWEEINFFTNPFSEDIGDILFGAGGKTNAIDFSSPDNTSDGNLKKRWKITAGRRCLIKGGSNPYRQQPFNEVIAAEIARRLNIPHVGYTLLWHKGAPYSVCEDFVTENTELVPAWRIVQTKKQPNNISLYRHFVNCAEALGIPGAVPFLDRLLVLDYILLNEDRHLNNFGALRDAKTLQWLGMAPVYDSGSSLGYDKTAPMMKDREEIICKPFKKTHGEQLKLVSSFDWIDFDALGDIREIIRGVLGDERAAGYTEERRVRTICDLAAQRVENLRSMAESAAPRADTLAEDVKENVAAKYI